MFIKYVFPGLCLTLLSACVQQGDRVDLGNLQTGATVSFVCAEGGEWGIKISNGTDTFLTQPKPVQIEVFRSEENVHQLATGYKSVKKGTDTIVAKARVVSGGGGKFDVEDRWNISGAVLSLSRKVNRNRNRGQHGILFSDQAFNATGSQMGRCGLFRSRPAIW